MAVSAFKDVNWGPVEPVGTDKLNTMAANTRYLFERAPKLYYNAYNVARDAGIKIAAGIATIPAGRQPVTLVNVLFGNFFTPGCRPVISNGITSAVNGRLIPSMVALGDYNGVPNYQGFTARICATEMHDRNYVHRTAYLNWIALGY